MEGKDLALARRLVDVDAKARGRALKKFRQWLNAKASLSALQEGGNGILSELDMLKIMKAIYFCMWHADKPLLQEELAKNLASLIHVFKRVEDTMLFVNAFFNTLQQQWSNIDKLRLDKFYLLMREFLKQCFKYLSNHEWSEAAMEAFTVALQSHPLELISEHISEGVKLHIIDIYIDELLITYRNIPMSTLITMIEPFKPLATRSPNKLIRQVTMANIFDRVSSLVEKGKGNLFEDRSLYEECISKMALNKGTLESCRNKLYTIKHKLLIMTRPEAEIEIMELPVPQFPCSEGTPPVVTETVEVTPDLVEAANSGETTEDVIVEKTSNNIEDIDLDGDETNHEDGDFANELNALVEGEAACEGSVDDDVSFDFSNDVFAQPENGRAEDQELLEMASLVMSVKTGKKRKRKSKGKKNNGKELHIIINPPLHVGFHKWRSLDDVNNALGAWYNEGDISPSTPSPPYDYTPIKKKRVTFSGEKPYVREFRKGSAAIESPEIIPFEKSLTPTKGILKPLKDLSP